MIFINVLIFQQDRERSKLWTLRLQLMSCPIKKNPQAHLEFVKHYDFETNFTKFQNLHRFYRFRIDFDVNCKCVKVWSVAYFIGSAVGPAVSGVLLEFLRTDSHKEGEETRYAFFGYCLILIMGGCCALLAGVVTSKIKNTT